MLQPSENFGAEQIRFLQREAESWIIKANEEIIYAAENGRNQAHVDIKSDLGSKFYNAPDALIEHFKNRGFDVLVNGQTSIIIKW